MGETTVTALKKINVSVKAGEFVAITGQSGSGKSTLMNLLGCLDIPTSGAYFIDGENVAHMRNDELATIRNKKIGFVFQKFHLLPDLTALDNVALPALYAGTNEAAAQMRAKEMLTMVELSDRIHHFPYQLSGGQQQRVAIARALINKPSILLADEPTGNLDSETGKTIIQLFKGLNEKQNVTIIMVTHEPEVAKHAQRTITLRDGRIVS
ncbi:ABC transporter ATP-binding protein [Candidatus Dependentiae bacterium]|nr:ABC transporter ATP-binding protein [Candidatus Dependentiae bacterium]